MRSNASLQFVILLTLSIAVHCQFEFNDLQVVHDIAVDAIQVAQVNCIALLRPADQNPQEKSAIDRLTRHLAKDSASQYGTRRPSVMAYTTELYEKTYMDPNQRKRDSCIYGAAVVMVSDSTSAQLAHLSADIFTFERQFWMLFSNGSEHATLLQNVQIRVTTRIWVVEQVGNGLYNMSEIGMVGEDLGYVAYILWAKNVGVVGSSNEMHTKITGLTLKVGTLENPPYTDVDRNENDDIISVTGFYGEIWNDLQEGLMFNSVFIEPEDGNFGTFNANGNWTGLYGMIVRKEVDVLLSSMTMSQERHQVVDFLHPILKTKYKIFYKKDAEIFDWLKVFRPLDYTVWIALVIWLIVGGTAAYVVTTVENEFQNPRRHFSFITCVYFVLRALCNQGSEQVPKLWALRIFFLTAYLIATIILPSYSASLISVLTLKTPAEPFKELSDILTTDYKLTINSESMDFDFFAKTTDPIHRKIYETSVIKSEPFDDYFEAMEVACENPKTVFFGTISDVAVAYSEDDISCEMLPLRSEISPAYQTIAVAKHSQYRPILNLRWAFHSNTCVLIFFKSLFRMMEFGIVDRYKQLYMPNAFKTSSDREISISLVDVGAVFIYLGILQALCVGILWFELFCWPSRLKEQNSSDQVTTHRDDCNWAWDDFEA